MITISADTRALPARVAYVHGVDPQTALASLREALAVSPHNAPLRLYLADTLAAAHRYDEALEEYMRVLAADPALTQARLGRLRSLFALERYDEAFALASAFQDDPHCPPQASLIYARLKARMDDAPGALAAYRAAVAHDPALADLAFEQVLQKQADVRHFTDTEFNQGGAVLEKPAITFADVGGMEPLKSAIRAKILAPLLHPELHRAFGKAAGGGILLYGPPGVGKTYIARATAGEMKSAFIAVGLEDVLDMWFGGSEAHLHALFSQARRNAPCVLFFDEVDALAASRIDLRGAAGRTLVNQFLAELDGVKTSNEGVLVLATTNAPWQLDSAFRRPGRFDRVLFVPPPDVAARAEIVRLMCRERPHGDIDYAAVANKTNEFSGADLHALVDAAVERKLEASLASGRIEPVETRDLLAALGSVKPSTREWFATARNYARYSNESGIYDDIVAYLKM